MAVTQISGAQHFQGLSTDPKPTRSSHPNLPNTSTFKETNTGDLYEYGDNGWFLKVAEPIRAILYDKNEIPIGSHPEPGGETVAFNIHDSDVHITLVNRHFIAFDSATEHPSSPISQGDYTIPVASTIGFAIGDDIVIKDAGGDQIEAYFIIVDLVVDTSITVNRPISKDYTTNATIELIEIEMNVAGSLASPVIYEIKPPIDEVWHIVRLNLQMLDQTAMDDALFGGLTKLTNGLIIRTLYGNGTIQLLTFWQNNAQMKADVGDFQYSDKAPSGFYGLTVNWNLLDVSVIQRLDGAAGDKMQVLIQDPLQNLDSLRMKIQGHIEGA